MFKCASENRNAKIGQNDAGGAPVESLRKVARHYRRLAAPYALLTRLHIWPPFLRQRAVAALDLRPGDRVLDIGCGNGASLPLLRRAVGPAGVVVGVDYVPEMLERARRNARLANAHLLRADAAQLPLRGEFDAALFCLSYFVIPDSLAALAQVWALLRPGGRVVIADGRFPFTPNSVFPFNIAAKLYAQTRFEPLMRTRSLPELRTWLEAQDARAEWQESRGGVFFLCRARKRQAGPE